MPLKSNFVDLRNKIKYINTLNGPSSAEKSQMEVKKKLGARSDAFQWSQCCKWIKIETMWFMSLSDRSAFLFPQYSQRTNVFEPLWVSIIPWDISAPFMLWLMLTGLPIAMVWAIAWALEKHTHRLVTNKWWLDSPELLMFPGRTCFPQNRPKARVRSQMLWPAHIWHSSFLLAVCVGIKVTQLLACQTGCFTLRALQKNNNKKRLVTFSALTSACAELKEPPVQPVWESWNGFQAIEHSSSAMSAIWWAINSLGKKYIL